MSIGPQQDHKLRGIIPRLSFLVISQFEDDKNAEKFVSLYASVGSLGGKEEDIYDMIEDSRSVSS